MDLREYLFKNRMTLVEFSRVVDFNRDHLSRVMHGRKRPSKKLARIIEKATNGHVKAQELLNFGIDEKSA